MNEKEKTLETKECIWSEFRDEGELKVGLPGKLHVCQVCCLTERKKKKMWVLLVCGDRAIFVIMKC